MLKFEIDRDNQNGKLSMGGTAEEIIQEALDFNKIFLNEYLAKHESHIDSYIDSIITIHEEFSNGKRIDMKNEDSVVVEIPREYEYILRMIARINREENEESQ